MKHRLLITILFWPVSFILGVIIAHTFTPVVAQQVTPAPWLSVAGPFKFCYAYPGQLGCADAEDKTGDPYVHGWKHDVDRARADCIRWGAVGTLPAAQLSLDPLCSGGTRLVGGIYWFDAPVVGTPAPSTPAATFTPFPSPPATFTPTPFPTSGTGTPTLTPIPTWTMAPITTPIIITFTPTPMGSQAICNSVVNIYGVDPRVKWGNVPSVHYTGEGGDCGTVVVLMEKSDVVTLAHELLDRGLINSLVREMVIRCLREPATCEDLNGLPIPIPVTPER